MVALSGHWSKKSSHLSFRSVFPSGLFLLSGFSSLRGILRWPLYSSSFFLPLGGIGLFSPLLTPLYSISERSSLAPDLLGASLGNSAGRVEAPKALLRESEGAQVTFVQYFPSLLSF
jgi:hypothetical protein